MGRVLSHKVLVKSNVCQNPNFPEDLSFKMIVWGFLKIFVFSFKYCRSINSMTFRIIADDNRIGTNVNKTTLAEPRVQLR